MRAVLERSGGFAGLRRTACVEPAALVAADEGRLREAAERAGFFDLPGELRSREPRPDGFLYRLVIEDGDRTVEVRFDEGAASEALLDLVELVRELAGE